MIKTIIFHVEYLCSEEKIIRKIELLENQTLDDLHEAIIYKAFGWDDPHMYSFFMDNKAYSQNRKMEYHCDPDGEMEFFNEGKPNSSNTKLKELNLKKKQKFLFIFDFGDDHMFSIRVHDFSEAKKETKYPVIIEEIGKAPEQYEYFEDK
ncbi:MAG: hypothetical protein AABX16_04910 [Nanoarchaeota archaeon]